MKAFYCLSKFIIKVVCKIKLYIECSKLHCRGFLVSDRIQEIFTGTSAGDLLRFVINCHFQLESLVFEFKEKGHHLTQQTLFFISIVPQLNITDVCPQPTTRYLRSCRKIKHGMALISPASAFCRGRCCCWWVIPHSCATKPACCTVLGVISSKLQFPPSFYHYSECKYLPN